MDISLNGSELLLGLSVMAALVVGLIVYLRGSFSRRSQHYLGAKHQPRADRIKDRSKYRGLDIFRLRPTVLNLGMVVALGTCLLLLSWTMPIKAEDAWSVSPMTIEVLDVIPPATNFPPPPPPPPPPPLIEEVDEDELIEDPPPPPDLDFDPDMSKNETPPRPPSPPTPTPPPTPVPPPPLPEDNAPHIFVERMPLFPGCSDLGSYADQKVCSEQKMIQAVYEEITYPAMARENGIEGTVVLRFIIERDGSMSNLEILRDQPAGLGEEALRALNSLAEKAGAWDAGMQNGRPVRVMMNLPVKFQLN